MPRALPPTPPFPRVDSVCSRARVDVSYTSIAFACGSLVIVTARTALLCSARTDASVDASPRTTNAADHRAFLDMLPPCAVLQTRGTYVGNAAKYSGGARE